MKKKDVLHHQYLNNNPAGKQYTLQGDHAWVIFHFPYRAGCGSAINR